MKIPGIAIIALAGILSNTPAEAWSPYLGAEGGVTTHENKDFETGYHFGVLGGFGFSKRYGVLALEASVSSSVRLGDIRSLLDGGVPVEAIWGVRVAGLYFVYRTPQRVYFTAKGGFVDIRVDIEVLPVEGPVQDFSESVSGSSWGFGGGMKFIGGWRAEAVVVTVGKLAIQGNVNEWNFRVVRDFW